MPLTLRQWFEGTSHASTEQGSEFEGDRALENDDKVAARDFYALVANPSVRVLVKLAFCEWVVDGRVAALTRLEPIAGDSDEDLVSLLSHVAIEGLSDKERKEAMQKLWPRLETVMEGSTPPLLACLARLENFWSADYGHRRGSRLVHAERAARLYRFTDSISLKAALEFRIAGRPPLEIYSFLESRAKAVPSALYLWTLGELAFASGQFDKAIEHLRRVEQNELSAAEVDENTLAQIRTEIAGVLHVSGHSESALVLLEQVLDFEDPAVNISAVLGALAIACAWYPDRVELLALEFVTNLTSAERLHVLNSDALVHHEEYIRGHNWHEPGSTTPWADLRPFRNRLINLDSPISRAWFRAIFAASDLEEAENGNGGSAGVDWKTLKTVLGTAAKDSGRHYFIESLDAAINANLGPLKWESVGRAWVNSEINASNDFTVTHGERVIEAVAGDSVRAASFAACVLPIFERRRRDKGINWGRFIGYVDHLIDHGLNGPAYRLASIVIAHDDSERMSFLLGLGAQRLGKGDEAFDMYQHVLAARPDHFAALYNSLLLCTSIKHVGRLEVLKPLVDAFSSDDTANEEKIRKGHASAVIRTTAPHLAIHAVVQAELASLRPKGSLEPTIDSLSLRDVVALFSLLRSCDREPDGMVLRPFDGSKTPYSSYRDGRRGIFGALRTGLVSVDPQTSLEAFVVKGGAVQGWHLGMIWWRVSASTLALVDNLRDAAQRRPWPAHWIVDLLSVAKDIAQGEVGEYIRFLASDRGWPSPDNEDELSVLTRALVDELSVSEAYYLAYLGAMSASDYKQRYPINGQQAANNMVKRTGKKLESVLAKKFPAKAFDRAWQVPRSAMSRALWEDLLQLGDEGFTKQISDRLLDRLH